MSAAVRSDRRDTAVFFVVPVRVFVQSPHSLRHVCPAFSSGGRAVSFTETTDVPDEIRQDVYDVIWLVPDELYQFII